MPMTDEQRKRLQELLKRIQSGEATAANKKANEELQKKADAARAAQQEKKPELVEVNPFVQQPFVQQPQQNYEPTLLEQEQEKRKPKEQKEVIKSIVDTNKRIQEEKAKYEEHMAGKVKFNYSNTAITRGDQVSDTCDKQQAKFAPNARYKVQTIDASNIDYAQDSDIELWAISDTQTGFKQNLGTDNSCVIGRDNLDGASADARYVIYNRSTGELFQYSTDDAAVDTKKKSTYASNLATKYQMKANDSSANYSSEMAAVMKQYEERCRALHIDPEVGPQSKEELAMVQELVDRYSELDSARSDEWQKNMHYADIMSQRAEYFNNKLKDSGKLSVAEYASAKAAQEQYADIQSCWRGEMTVNAFKDKYGFNPTVDAMNSSAKAAALARGTLDNFSGELYDDGSRLYDPGDGTQVFLSLTESCNKIADDYLLLDSVEKDVITKNAEETAYVFDMNDEKQMNSIFDVYRNAYVSAVLDSKGKKGAKWFAHQAKTVKNFFADLKEFKELANSTIFDDWHDDNGELHAAMSGKLDQGISGLLLSHLRDAGNLFVGYASALMNARGFAGDVNVVGDNKLSYAFRDGVLNNADYYTARAVQGDPYAFNNIKLAMEAQLRGDINSDLTAWNNVQMIANYGPNAGVDVMGKYNDEHPFQSMAFDMLINVLFDPTTYTGLTGEIGVSDDVVKKYTSALRNVLTDDAVRAGTNISDDFLKQFDDVAEGYVRSAINDTLKLSKGKDIALSNDAVISLYGNILNNPNIMSELDEGRKLNLLQDLIGDATATLNHLAGDDNMARLLKESQKAVRFAQNVNAVDKTCAALMVGPISMIKPIVHNVKLRFLNLAAETETHFATVHCKNVLNGMLYNMSKAIDKGIRGLGDFHELTKVGFDSALLDVAEQGLRSGVAADDILRQLGELSITTDSVAADFARAIIDDELSKMGSAIQMRLGLRDMLLDNSKIGSYVTSEALDDIVVTTTAGKITTYGEYVDYARDVASKFDTPNVSVRVGGAVDSHVEKIERLITLNNNTVTRRQVAMMHECLTDVNYEKLAILRTIPVETIAPDFRDEWLHAIAVADADLTAVQDLTAAVNKYEDIVKSIHTATDTFYRPITGAMQHPDVRSLTSVEYVEQCLQQAGVKATADEIQSVIIKDMNEVNAAELAGTYYVLKESAEANINGILDNTSLQQLLKNDRFTTGEFAQYAKNFNLDNVQCAQYTIYSQLGSGREYHAIMDAVCGMHEDLNAIAHQIALSPRNAAKFKADAVQQIVEHIDTVQSVAGTGVQITADSRKIIEQAVDMLYSSIDRNTLCVMPTREYIYSTLLKCDEIAQDADFSNAVRLAIEEGAYTSSNTTLGVIIDGHKLNELIARAKGIDEWHVNHLKTIMDAILTDDETVSVGLRTLLDTELAKSYISDTSLIQKCVETGTSTTNELNYYIRDIDAILDRVEPDMFTTEQLESLRTAVLASCNNLSDGAELRHLDYLKAIDLSDTHKGTAAILDAIDRFGVDPRALSFTVSTSDPELAKLSDALINKGYIYKGKPTGRIVDMDSDIFETIIAQKQFEEQVLGNSSGYSNLAKAKSDIHRYFYPDDTAAQIRFEARARMAGDMDARYSALNTKYSLSGRGLKSFRKRQIEFLRDLESDMWNANVQRVINYGKDELDRALLCTHSNAIVCDTAEYPELAKWVAARQSDGYIITRANIAGRPVSIVSLDVQQLDAEHIQYLINAQQSSDMSHISDLASMQRSYNCAQSTHYFDDFRTNVLNAYDGAQRNLSSNFKQSAIGSKVNMNWHNELQSMLPAECRLTPELTAMHNDAYMGNMLMNTQYARACGSMKGHALGSWFYAECAALEHSDGIDNIYNAVHAYGNSVQSLLDYGGLRASLNGKSFRQAMHDINNSNSHIVRLSVVGDFEGVGSKLEIQDLTPLYNAKFDPKHMTTGPVHLREDHILDLDQHFIFDDATYRTLLEDVKSNNRLLKYATVPRYLTAATDVLENIRSAYVHGMLYASNLGGTAFRNMVDSNTKALAETGYEHAGDYIHNWVHEVEWQNDYVMTMEHIYQKYGFGPDAINSYLTAECDAEQAAAFLMNHTLYSRTGTADDEIMKAFNRISNNKLLDEVEGLPGTARDSVIAAFNKTRDSKWINSGRRDIAHTMDTRAALRSNLSAALADVELADREGVLDALANLYGRWQMGSAQHWYNKMFDSDTTLGKLMCGINKTEFENMEVRARNALMRTFMETGESADSAAARVLKTQFDYGIRTSSSVNAWDKVMPFAKYQFANAAYWLDVSNYSAHTMANMSRLTRATSSANFVADASDAIKTSIIMAYYKAKNGEQNTTTDNASPMNVFISTLENSITNYKGTSGEYTEGLDFGGHHYLKVGNGFFDTLDWLGSVLALPNQMIRWIKGEGEEPTLLKDTLFGPLQMGVELAEYINNPSDESIWSNMLKQPYDAISLVPVFGNLLNMCISNAKSVIANKQLLALVLCSNGCMKSIKEFTANDLLQIGMCGASMIAPSILGTYKDSGKSTRKVFEPYIDDNGTRITWSKLSDDEKKKYIFLPGISNEHYYNITPKNLYGLYGRLAAFGLDKNSIKLLTDKTRYNNDAFYTDSNGKRYVNADYLETIVIDMLEQGYAIHEIAYLLSINDEWYNLTTHQIIKGEAAIRQEMLNEGFLAQYKNLPEYIRYQPDMYKEMMERYKALGMSTAEAWYAMMTSNEYIDENGNLTVLTAEQAADYTKWLKDDYYEGQEDNGFLEWYGQLPEYIRYEKGAYSRTLAYLKQMFSDEEAKQMIVNGAYYTPDGRLINCTNLERASRFTNNGAFQDAAGYWHKAGDFEVNGYWFHKGDNPYLGRESFQAYWNELPDYLRYTKGAWSQTNKVLKEAGFDYNTRMQAMLDGAYAMQVDPNSEYFKQLLAQQKLQAVTKTVYVTKKVPLRECSNVNGKWVWNGPQSVKCTDLGDGYTMETVDKDMEHIAAGLGLSPEKKWKSYDAAEVEVQVPQTVTEMVSDSGQIFGRVITTEDGRTWVIVPCPPYQRSRRGYPRRGYTRKQWKQYNKYKRRQYERIHRVKGYAKNNKPMTIGYSNVRTYSKQHFMTGQATGYNYWYQWGDASITNHRNRNGRLTQCPNTYRNPRARQRTLYKEMYGKFGASRMRQRQNIASYSNMSITKLRRNDIYNRMYNVRINGAKG